MPKKLSSQRRDTIVRYYQEHRNAVVVGKRLGVAPSTVYRILEERGLSAEGGLQRWRDASAKIKQTEWPSVAKRYRAGERVADSAATFGCTVHTVRNALLRMGVERRTVGAQFRRIEPDVEERIVRHHLSGVPATTIAAQLGTSQPVVARILRARGIYSRKNASGPTHGNWKGGEIFVGDYIYVLAREDDPLAWAMKNSALYVAKHRLVMARHLSRPLEPHETVHHINNDRTDNAIENLQLRQGRHGKGATFQCADCESRNVRAVGL